MSNKKAQKRSLYAQGVAAAKAVGIQPEVYICPLCLNGYGEDAVLDGTLTLEHVPAESLGGNGIILTCKTCNNTAGHALESQSHLRAKQNNFISTLVGKELGHGGCGVAKFGDVQINIELIRSSDAVTLKASKNNSPAALLASQAFFEKASIEDNWKNLSFQVSSKDAFHVRRAHVADLKAAFLSLSAAFGYSFAMHDVLAPVRKQIAEPESHIIDNWWGKADMPALSIGIVENEGLAIVSLTSGSIAIPWPTRKDGRWINASTAEPKSMIGWGWPWPKSFEAYIDHL